MASTKPTQLRSLAPPGSSARTLPLGKTAPVLSHEEQEQLNAACRKVPLTTNVYLATDLVSTLLDTVIDYQQHTTTVRNAIRHFETNRWDEVRTLGDLEALFSKYSNDVGSI